MGEVLVSFEVHARNMDIKCDSGEVCEGNEKLITRNWKKSGPCYKVTRNLAEV